MGHAHPAAAQLDGTELSRLACSAAFAVAFPVNRWLIARGTGHAAVHAHHRAWRSGANLDHPGVGSGTGDYIV